MLMLYLGVLATTAETVAIVPGIRVSGCISMIGADFACPASDGAVLDACQLRTTTLSAALAVCTNITGCTAIVQSGEWSTLKAAFVFAGSESLRSQCKDIASRISHRLQHTDSRSVCHDADTRRWQRLGCGEHARAAVLGAVDPRPARLESLQMQTRLQGQFRCVSDTQIAKEVKQPVRIESAQGCIHPPPTSDATACSFPRRHALDLCLSTPTTLCQSLHCERGSDYCQALQNTYVASAARPSFGDVDLYFRRSRRSDGANASLSAARCSDRHYTDMAIHFGARASSYPTPKTLVCEQGASACSVDLASAKLLDDNAERLRQLLITTAQRFLTRSTANEPTHLLQLDGPLVLYPPASFAIRDTVKTAHDRAVLALVRAKNPDMERAAYRAQYENDKWLFDVQAVYDTFFGKGTAFHASSRKGFFVEAGAVQGTVYDSNSIFFERFLGWKGLLVEANPYSFAKLMTRRPGSYRIETALCERVSTLRFALPDKQRTADGCCGKANNEGNYAARCTPVSEILRGCGVTHIDFWSLDVEGGELEVLKGFDWHRHSMSVLLIEVWASSRNTYAQFLQSHGLTKLDSFNSPTNLNEVWYNRSSIAPRSVL